MKKHLPIIATAALWLLIAGGLIAYKQSVIYTGTRIILETKPIDPYDILKGDYVRLNYAINSVRNTTTDGKNLKRGTKYFVILKKSEGAFWQAEGVTEKYLENETAIAGIWNGQRMNYGIEEYFIPEGKGRDIERLSGKGLEVEAAVDNKGDSAIIRLLNNGIEITTRDIQ